MEADMLSRLVKWSGYASIFGGVLFGVAVVLHPLRDGISIFNSGVAYPIIHDLGVFGLMFQLLGLVGLYIREAEAMGKRGLTSFLVVFFAQLFYILLLVVDGAVNSVLSIYDIKLVHATSVAGVDPRLSINLFIIGLPALVLFFLGYSLFGASLLRAKVQPLLGSLLITIGAPVYIIGGINIFILGPASPIISIIEIAGAIPLAIGYVLLGLKLRSEAAMRVGQASYAD
jgi:hypothetical protein